MDQRRLKGKFVDSWKTSRRPSAPHYPHPSRVQRNVQSTVSPENTQILLSRASISLWPQTRLRMPPSTLGQLLRWSELRTTTVAVGAWLGCGVLQPPSWFQNWSGDFLASTMWRENHQLWLQCCRLDVLPPTMEWGGTEKSEESEWQILLRIWRKLKDWDLCRLPSLPPGLGGGFCWGVHGIMNLDPLSLAFSQINYLVWDDIFFVSSDL